MDYRKSLYLAQPILIMHIQAHQFYVSVCLFQVMIPQQSSVDYNLWYSWYGSIANIHKQMKCIYTDTYYELKAWENG